MVVISGSFFFLKVIQLFSPLWAWDRDFAFDWAELAGTQALLPLLSDLAPVPEATQARDTFLNEV